MDYAGAEIPTAATVPPEETELMITVGKTLNQILAKVSPGNKKDLSQT